MRKIWLPFIPPLISRLSSPGLGSRRLTMLGGKGLRLNKKYCYFKLGSKNLHIKNKKTLKMSAKYNIKSKCMTPSKNDNNFKKPTMIK